MNVCKVSPKKSHMIKSVVRGKPYVLCLKNVEIEPLSTYVVISLQLTALFQGHSLAILIYFHNFLVVSTTLDVSLLTSSSHTSHISYVYPRLYP